MAASRPFQPSIPEPAVFAGWEQYPTNLQDYDPVQTRGIQLNRQIANVASDLFDQYIRVRVIDIVEQGGALNLEDKWDKEWVLLIQLPDG